ncbi:hypothetical protein B296_00049071 [Ensete ventricosum]|uniref:Uncharacterized protein n=1 Tax=Ensete ventricosum TaxID=4639 RepID=A0A426YS80_ENSVE|nr:hypothetical protein B296_00049071 [Ensete ventricosum]
MRAWTTPALSVALHVLGTKLPSGPSPLLLPLADLIPSRNHLHLKDHKKKKKKKKKKEKKKRKREREEEKKEGR